MNTNLKTALIAIGAFGAGYLVAGVRLQRKFDVELADELFNTEEAYKKNLGAADKCIDDFQSMYVRADDELRALKKQFGVTPTTDKLIAEQEALVVPEEAKAAYVAYGGHVPEQRAPEVRAVVPEDESNIPFIITDEEFIAGELNYTTATLTYYEGDQVLAAVDDSRIDDGDKDKAVGSCLTFFKEMAPDAAMYVRCHELQHDFEIVRSPGSYDHEVMGLDDTNS